MSEANADLDQEDFLRIGIAVMTKQLDRYAEFVPSSLRIFLTAFSAKARTKRLQEAGSEATALEQLKQKKREESVATSSLAPRRRTERISQKKEKTVRTVHRATLTC